MVVIIVIDQFEGIFCVRILGGLEGFDITLDRTVGDSIPIGYTKQVHSLEVKVVIKFQILVSPDGDLYGSIVFTANCGNIKC